MILEKNQEFSTSCPSHIVTFFSELSRSASVKFLSVNFFIRNQLLRNFIVHIYNIMHWMGCRVTINNKEVSIRHTLMYIQTSGEIIAPCSKPRNNFWWGSGNSTLVRSSINDKLDCVPRTNETHTHITSFAKVFNDFIARPTSLAS